MTVQFSLTGDKALDKAFRDLEPKFRRKVAQQAMRKGMKIIQQTAKQNAPVGETGSFKRAIKVKAGKRSRRSFGIDVRIDTKDVAYAPSVELGSKRQAGHHVLENALNSKGKEVIDLIIKECWNGIEKIAKEGGK